MKILAILAVVLAVVITAAGFLLTPSEPAYSAILLVTPGIPPGDSTFGLHIDRVHSSLFGSETRSSIVPEIESVEVFTVRIGNLTDMQVHDLRNTVQIDRANGEVRGTAEGEDVKSASAEFEVVLRDGAILTHETVATRTLIIPGLRASAE